MKNMQKAGSYTGGGKQTVAKKEPVKTKGNLGGSMQKAGSYTGAGSQRLPKMEPSANKGDSGGYKVSSPGGAKQPWQGKVNCSEGKY